MAKVTHVSYVTYDYRQEIFSMIDLLKMVVDKTMSRTATNCLHNKETGGHYWSECRNHHWTVYYDDPLKDFISITNVLYNSMQNII